MLLDDAAVARRLAFLRLEEGDLARLRALHGLLRDYAEPFSRSFYDHLLAFEETARLLPDQETIERLRQSQARYFRTLTTGRYDRQYISDRLRVGLVHQRIGLAPGWYLGAYAWYLSELVPEIWRRLGGDHEQLIATLQALTKIILLDMGLVMDTYIAVDRQAISALEEYAEAAFAGLPFGVLVVGPDLRVRSANPKVLYWLGLSPEAIRGRALTELLPVSELGSLAREVADGKTVSSLRATLPIPGRQGGIPVRVILTGVPLPEGPGVLAVIDDLTAQMALEDRLDLIEQQFASAFEFAAIGMALVAPDGRWLKVNRALCELTGYREEELLQLTFQDITHPDDLDTDLEYVRRMLDGRIQTYQMEKRYVRKEGRIVWVLLSVSLVRDAQGRPLFFISQIQDISRRKELEAERERLSSVVEATPDFVAIADLALRVQYLNAGARRLLGLGDEEDVSALQIPEGHPWWAARRVLGEGIPTAIRRGTWVGETAFLTRDGREVPVLQTIVAHRDPSGNVAFLSTIARDISDRKAFEVRIEELAYRDALTGLPNRRLLADRLERALIAASRHRRSVGVLLLDLDRFKLVNDSFGHETGDTVLQSTARRLQRVVRRGDTVARLGGDEFVVVVEDLAPARDVEAVARKILDAISRPYTAKEPSGASVRIMLTTSIGISLYPDDGDDVSALLRRADAAMYRAKREGGHRFSFFATDMEAEARARLDLERALRLALAGEEFRLHYQPIVELRRRRVVGFEALLRWDRLGRGLVGPAEFIPVLEQTDLIHPVGEWVLRTACRQARSWRDAGLPAWSVAINVSAKQLAAPKWADQVAQVLDESGLRPSDLVVEITETALVEPSGASHEALHRLRELGVRVAMDDFGTGYSSLGQLRALPVDVVKISQGFVRDAPAEEVDEAIVEAIIAVAHKRGLQVVAEGVETTEQLAFLRRRGCDYAQGYLLGRPVPPELVMWSGAASAGRSPRVDRSRRTADGDA